MEKLSVKAIRINIGMSQEEMANRLGISIRTYCDKENGKNKWLWEEILQICNIAKISPNLIK